MNVATSAPARSPNFVTKTSSAQITERIMTLKRAEVARSFLIFTFAEIIILKNI